MSLIEIGLSGLRAAQAGLATTGNNISNVNTPGFSRQQAVQAPSISTFTGSGYIGQGVTTGNVQRVYSDFLSHSLRDATGASAAATAYSTEVTQVDGFLSDSSSNLSSATDAFFKAIQSVADNPSDTASRQTLLATASTVASRFNDLNARLQQQGADVNEQIANTVSTVNTLAQQVATLNRSILNDGRDPSNNQVPNDLLDQRDALIQQIAGAVGATTLPQSDGTISVFIGNGQPLVVGTTANALTTVPDDQDPTKKQLAVTVSGQQLRIPTAQVTQGTIGGLFQFRDDVLSQTQNTLGQIAIGLGAAINAQNALGQDANGSPGAALFQLGSPSVTARATNSAGSGLTVGFADPSQLTGADYRLDYDGTNYKLTNLSDQTTHTYASLPQTVDGIKIDVSGPLAAGDRFTISPTRNGARDIALVTNDPKKIATAAPVVLAQGPSNTGSAQLGSLAVLPASPLPANLRSPVNVVFHVSASTTTYDLVDATTNTTLSSANPYTNGASITQNGWNLTLSGSPADGDTFTVGPNVNGSGDNRNALLLAAVQQDATVTRSGSAQDAYNGLVGQIGNKANEATSLADSETGLLTQTQENRDSVSGVNLDEEAANLQKYEQAYEAASKSIATASVLFQSILALFA